MDRVARKPGSVRRRGCPRRPGDHSSRPAVTDWLEQPTRKHRTGRSRALPSWPCSGWGLPCHPRYRGRGGLLLHPFTLTGHRCLAAPGPGGLLSVALSSRSPSPGVTRHPTLRSPDFPLGEPPKRLTQRSPAPLGRRNRSTGARAPQCHTASISVSRGLRQRRPSRRIRRTCRCAPAPRCGRAASLCHAPRAVAHVRG